ncbi:MAG TPA: DUF177 domain-containing protein [Hyphomicrobiaceae bacterium]|nr:DUF177 domain-containing protein [Hyphomicrobiaceae bacterium]
MLGELAWKHEVQDIPEEGLSVVRTATPEECDAVARSLDLLACRSLTARYALKPRGGGHIQLSGTVEAQVEQSCVVTLEPLLNRVAESFTVDYWPESEMPERGGGVVDMHDEPDLEPIVAGRIEVGNVVYQALAGGIDLFPRKPGAEFEPPQSTEGDDASHPEGPFAALEKIKNKR